MIEMAKVLSVIPTPRPKYQPQQSPDTSSDTILLSKIYYTLSEINNKTRTKNILFNLTTSTTMATPVKPSSKDVIANAAIAKPGYDIIQVRNVLNRNADILYVTNDGPGNLYLLSTPDRKTWSGDEILIKEGEVQAIADVYELRVRSPSAGCISRISEYKLSSSISLMKGTDGTNLQIIKVDSEGNMIAVMKGTDGTTLRTVKVDTSGQIISIMKGASGNNVNVDSNGNLVSVIKGNYSGTLETIAVDSAGFMQADVSKAEKIEIISTDKDTHFTGTINYLDHEKENITGLTVNKYMIRGVNIQSIQPLKFRLVFWGKDTFDNTDLDVDSYIDDVELDMSQDPAFRINNANQYRLNVGDLNILYEDYDVTNELHISLQNLSATAKNAGATGYVQLDIKMTPRL